MCWITFEQASQCFLVIDYLSLGQFERFCFLIQIFFDFTILACRLVFLLIDGTIIIIRLKNEIQLFMYVKWPKFIYGLWNLVPLIGSNLFKCRNFLWLSRSWKVSIPLIGSNLFKFKYGGSCTNQILGVSIPLIGSNLFKFIKERSQLWNGLSRFNPLDRVKFV